MKSFFCPTGTRLAAALPPALALLLLLAIAAPATAQELPATDDGPASGTGDDLALDEDRGLGSDPDIADPLPHDREFDYFSRAGRRGEGFHAARVVYQAPPFDGDRYWVPGGVMRVDNPILTLIPLDVQYLFDSAGQMGATIEGRIWGNAVWSWGLEFWGVVEPDDFSGIFETAPRVEGVWRLQTDFGALMWMDPLWGFEVSLLLGMEKDILTTRVQARDIGFYWGVSGRATLWRFQLRTDWMMRIDTDHDLGFGDLRHALRAEVEFEAFRIDHFGLMLGYWTYFVSGGKPRNGVSIGIRVWFAPGRDRPDWADRYDGE